MKQRASRLLSYKNSLHRLIPYKTAAHTSGTGDTGGPAPGTSGIQELEEVRIPEQVEDPVPGGFVSDLIEFSAELDQGRCLLLAESDQQALRPHCVLSEEGRFGRGSACCISCISCGKGTHRYNA